jgi:DNA-binding response OmpR family regulator
MSLSVTTPQGDAGLTAAGTFSASGARGPVLTTSKATLLVVEDDDYVRELLMSHLTHDGYEVHQAQDSMTAINVLAQKEPDLVLLDIMLGAEDGRDLLQEMRRVSEVPVVFLTARSHEIDRIAGLKMGADDYVVKPFSAGELSARVESVLRRTRRTTRPSEIVIFGDLQINFSAREVQVCGRVVDLTPKEFDLLAFLAASPRQAFSRAQLLDHVWSSSADWQGEATVTEHIRRLRRKIERDPERPRWITTVRGVGYRFETASDPGLS